MFPNGQKLPNDQFTENAFLTPLVGNDKNNDFTVGSLCYEPKTRSYWHTHPKGQVLIILMEKVFFRKKVNRHAL
jgi:quercetin dioxygenase-like cupin family protein